MARRFRILGLLLGALALGALVAIVALDPVGRRRAALTRRVEALQARVEGRDPTRPVLHGEATPGNAWTFYERALQPLELERERLSELRLIAATEAEQERERRKELLAGFEASLEDLRRGARSSSARRPVDWEWEIPWAASPDWQSVQDLALLSVARSLVAIDEGRPSEGVRALLDGWQFGRDLGACPTLTTSSMGALIVPGEVLPIHLRAHGLAGLDESALDLLENGLETLDSSWPRDLPFLDGEGLFIARLYLEPHRTSELQLERPTWRIGPLRTLALLHAAETQLDLLDETRTALDAPGADLEAIFARHRLAAEESTNPYLMTGPRLGKYARVQADAPLRIRALRALIARARGRDAPGLLEVVGRAILLEEQEGSLRARFRVHDGTEEVLNVRLAR